MIMRNGIRSTLRARGRTALFTVLIALLTIILTLGLGLWVYCDETLVRMNKNYQSIALVEYMGEHYPESDRADSDAREAARLLNMQDIGSLLGIHLWESTDEVFASMDGYERRLGRIPYENYGVIQVSDLKPLYAEETQWVSDISLLPQSCIIINTVTEERTYCAPGMDPIFVPRYTKIGGEYFHEVSENGNRVKKPVDPDHFPEHYILIDGKSWYNEGIFPEEYNTDETTNTICYYDPDQEVYGFSGQVLKGYFAYMDAVLYSKNQREHTLVVLETGHHEFVPQKDKSYLLHGMFIAGTSSYPTFQLAEFPDDKETLPYLELTGEEDRALTDSVFADYASAYRQANNYICLKASDDIGALECFHQKEIRLEQGRFPDAGEPGVCVVDGWTANALELSLEDEVNVQLLSSLEKNRFNLTQTQEERTLKIVGITNPSEEYAGVLWTSKAEGNFGSPLFGYVLGRAVLDNARGVSVVDELSLLVPDGVRVTLYDQGYFAAAQPIKVMRSVALSVTIACACGVLGVLFLFACLFVGRQKDNVTVLVSFGTPAGKIRCWLLSGVGVISGMAVLLGALAGGFLLDTVVWAVMAAARDLYTSDQRYSEAVIGVTHPVEGPVMFLCGPLLPPVSLCLSWHSCFVCFLFVRLIKNLFPNGGRLMRKNPGELWASRSPVPRDLR